MDKTRIYPELHAIKGKIRECKESYRSIATQLKISPSTLSDRLNGYSVFTLNEVIDLFNLLNNKSLSLYKKAAITEGDMPSYFFPQMLRNATEHRDSA